MQQTDKETVSMFIYNKKAGETGEAQNNQTLTEALLKTVYTEEAMNVPNIEYKETVRISLPYLIKVLKTIAKINKETKDKMDIVDIEVSKDFPVRLTFKNQLGEDLVFIIAPRLRED